MNAYVLAAALVGGVGVGWLSVRILRRHRAVARVALLHGYRPAAPDWWKQLRQRLVLLVIGADWRRDGGVSVGLGAAGFMFGGPVLAVLCSSYALLGLRGVRFALQERRRAVALSRCGEALAGLADDMRAGSTGEAALDTVARQLAQVGDPGEWAAVIRAIDQHHGIVAALRHITGDLAQPSRRLAMAWQLLDAGIPLGEVVQQLDAEITAWNAHRELLRAETAAASATAVLLAGLPFVGVAMGYLLGADPVHVLLHTSAGAVCALLGAALQLGGWTWARRICAPPQLVGAR